MLGFGFPLHLEVFRGTIWMTVNLGTGGGDIGTPKWGLPEERLSPGELPRPDPPARFSLYLSARHSIIIERTDTSFMLCPFSLERREHGDAEPSPWSLSDIDTPIPAGDWLDYFKYERPFAARDRTVSARCRAETDLSRHALEERIIPRENHEPPTNCCVSELFVVL